jgi:hypothetical protein
MPQDLYLNHRQSAMSAQLACVTPLSMKEGFLASIVHETFLSLKLPLDVGFCVHMSKWILANHYLILRLP